MQRSDEMDLLFLLFGILFYIWRAPFMHERNKLHRRLSLENSLQSISLIPDDNIGEMNNIEFFLF